MFNYIFAGIFDEKSPISWASALHHRHVQLKPLESIESPTTFETEIYRHFERFNARRQKTGVSRILIPYADELCQYQEISRIVQENCQEEAVAEIPSLAKIKIER